MTGFSGRIMLEGHLDTAKSHLGTAMKLADKLNVWKQTQGISAVTKAYDLGNGSYCVVVDLAHMRAMQIVAPSVSELEYETFEQILDRYEYTGVADVVSGKVPNWDDAQIVTEQIEIEGEDGKPVIVDIKVLKDFVPTQRTAQRYSDVERRYRLNLEESPIFATINPQADVVYSQHAHVKPSCYTGAMRKLVQFILGMGQITRPTWEERWIEQNKKGYLPIKQTSIETEKTSETLSAFNLYYKKEVVKIQNTYDYRFAKTHGVAFDPDGKPYLIEISMRGVHAMPLYMDPVSLTVQGRKRYLEVSPELSHVFDTFGGIPLGVNFPFTSSENIFDKWKRAGEILDLAPQGIEQFYSKAPYSSSMGWAFNSKGSEAHNTCYNFREDSIKVSYHYRIDIKLDKANPLPELDGYRAQLAARFREVYKINKCRRMTDVDARILLLKYEKDAEEGDKAFDELEVKSNMKGTATLQLVNSGLLYYPTGNNPDAQPDIKFPEPLLNGLVSVDFRAEAFGVLSGPSYEVRCDTPVFVCMVQDSVEVVNYFYDSRRSPSQTTNTRGPCQYTGSWTISGTSSDPEIKGHFYSNRWDFRKEMADAASSTTYTGRKIGSFGRAETKALFAMCVWVSSYAQIFVNYTSSGYTQGNLGVSVAIPLNDRSCYYMLREESYGFESTASGGYSQVVPGTHAQWWELYNFVFHWREPCSSYSLEPPIRESNYRCIARKLRDIHYEGACRIYQTVPAEIFYSVCPENVFAWTSITVNAPLWSDSVIGSTNFAYEPSPASYSNGDQTGSSAKFEIYMINDSDFGPIITDEGYVKLSRPAGSDEFGLSRSSWWWRFSPDKIDGTMPYLSVTQSCLGATIVNYSKDFDSGSDSIGEPVTMQGNASTCYTGVIE